MDMRKSGLVSSSDSGSYSDLNRLNQLKVGDKNSDGNMRKVAQEFESLFLSELHKSMRSATENDGPSPVVPNSVTPEQPAVSKRRAWAAKRAMSMLPSARKGVSMAGQMP